MTATTSSPSAVNAVAEPEPGSLRAAHRGSTNRLPAALNRRSGAIAEQVGVGLVQAVGDLV